MTSRKRSGRERAWSRSIVSSLVTASASAGRATGRPSIVLTTRSNSARPAAVGLVTIAGASPGAASVLHAAVALEQALTSRAAAILMPFAAPTGRCVLPALSRRERGTAGRRRRSCEADRHADRRVGASAPDCVVSRGLAGRVGKCHDPRGAERARGNPKRRTRSQVHSLRSSGIVLRETAVQIMRFPRVRFDSPGKPKRRSWPFDAMREAV
jgi:hypothetical protein